MKGLAMVMGIHRGMMMADGGEMNKGTSRRGAFGKG